MESYTCCCHHKTVGPVKFLPLTCALYRQRGSLERAGARQLRYDPLRRHSRTKASNNDFSRSQEEEENMDSASLPENFCIIESRESVKNFADMQLEEIKRNIAARRNRIFLLMEEVRRLRIQQRVKVIYLKWGHIIAPSIPANQASSCCVPGGCDSGALWSGRNN